MSTFPLLLPLAFAMVSMAASAQPSANTARGSTADAQAVAPALQAYAERLDRDVWNRGGLAKRDRSLVTVSTLIARGQTATLRDQVLLALDNGLKPSEISGAVVQLAFYAGFANAQAAVAPIRAAFLERKIGPDQLPQVSAAPLPLNEAAEAERARRVSESFGTVSPSLVKDTTEFLFRDLWLRPDLAPRDRSLVTVSSLIANGQVGQVEYHLGRAMDAGLTREQTSELVSHIAFYAGWPNAFSALPVVKKVLEDRKG